MPMTWKQIEDQSKSILIDNIIDCIYDNTGDAVIFIDEKNFRKELLELLTIYMGEEINAKLGSHGKAQTSIHRGRRS